MNTRLACSKTDNLAHYQLSHFGLNSLNVNRNVLDVRYEFCWINVFHNIFWENWPLALWKQKKSITQLHVEPANSNQKHGLRLGKALNFSGLDISKFQLQHYMTSRMDPQRLSLISTRSSHTSRSFQNGGLVRKVVLACSLHRLSAITSLLILKFLATTRWRKCPRLFGYIAKRLRQILITSAL